MRLLKQLISPAVFLRYSRFAEIVLYVGLSVLITGLLWGVFLAPADYQQGDAVRIMYLHVPMAFASMLAFLVAAVFGVFFLTFRARVAQALMAACIIPGMVACLLALATGSLWGKPVWGTWWVWDARLTSEFVLLLLYVAVLYLLREDRRVYAALLLVVGSIDLPIIHYSVNWYATLHQGASITAGTSAIDSTMLWPLLTCIAGTLLVGVGYIVADARADVLLENKRRQRLESYALS